MKTNIKWTTPEEFKQRFNRMKHWKEMPETTRKELRDSWKELDTYCKDNAGRIGYLQSIIIPGMNVKGCITSHSTTAMHRFIDMVNQINKQMDKQETQYAVYHGDDHGRVYHYETDGEWHHIKFEEQNDFPEDYTSIQLESHQRIDHWPGEGHTPSYIEPHITRMQRMRKTRDEHNIQQMLDYSKKLTELWPAVGKTEKDDVHHKLVGNLLAQKVREHFEME